MNDAVSTSQFYMWRAVVAMAHADGVVTPHEVNFLQEQMKEIALSPGQLQTLAGDISKPQDIHAMFHQISDPQDKLTFFKLARVLSWSDGDFDAQERRIIDCLEKEMASSENRQMLEDTRASVREITLDGDQWQDQVGKKGLLRYLGNLIRS
jgi:uncharacterized membrane protein YebE (DUF533 family)